MVAELIDGFVPAVPGDAVKSMANIAVKAGAAIGGVQFASGFIGQRAAQFFAAGLTFSALRSVLPIDAWISDLIGMVRQDQSFAAGQGSWHYQDASLSQVGTGVGPGVDELAGVFQ